jgi:hypothetical protein
MKLKVRSAIHGDHDRNRETGAPGPARALVELLAELHDVDSGA